jgi:hypothetical protein
LGLFEGPGDAFFLAVEYSSEILIDVNGSHEIAFRKWLYTVRRFDHHKLNNSRQSYNNFFCVPLQSSVLFPTRTVENYR